MSGSGFSMEWEFQELRHASPEERSAFAQLTIRAGREQVLTQLEDLVVRTVRPYVRVSLLPLARWLASNWWRLCFEPRRVGPLDYDWRAAHELPSCGGGYLWPLITFEADGETVMMEGRSGRAGSAVRFLTDACVPIPRAEFESEVANLIEAVRDRLADSRTPDEPLDHTWQSVCRERSCERLSRLRRREALLGLDPEVLDEAQVRAWERQGAWMGEEALDEILAFAGAGRFEQVEHALRLRSEQPFCSLDFSAFGRLARRSPGPADEGDRGAAVAQPPWQRGHELAARARQELSLGAEPIDSDTLSELVGSSQLFGLALGRQPLGVGFRRPEEPWRVNTSFRTPRPEQRRFEVARLICDALEASPHDTLLPLSPLKTARQKRQRAFAAEFLCPIEALRNRVSLPFPSDDELADAAEEFGVSDWVARHALVNAGLADRSILQVVRAA